MNEWIFFDFLDTRGVNLIRQWLDSSDVPVKAAAKIDARILYMQAQATWPPQYVSALAGWPDLFELRIVSAGSQFRPIGFYGPSRGEFTLLIGAVEKSKIRSSVLEVADERRKIATQDRTRIRRHEFRAGRASR
jgi:hypothetical protein